jgi:predicted nucleic acid-binding protein
VSVFVDTSAFYAAADRADRAHEATCAALAAGDDLVTSDHVVVESWFLLDVRFGRHAAQRFWSGIRDGAVEIVTTSPADLDRAWQIAGAYPDQDFSIVDMTSFSVMERLGITRVLTLDHHFAVYRYGSRLDRAFEIVR